MKFHFGCIDRRIGAMSTGAPQRTNTTHRALERPSLPVHAVANMPSFLRSRSADAVDVVSASGASLKRARIFRSASCLEIGSKTTITQQTVVLSRALWMGLLDRIVHYFGGTTKRDRIEKNLRDVCAPPDYSPRDEGCEAPQQIARRLHAFANLKRIAKPEHQQRFVLDVVVEPRTVDGERISVLRYSLAIDGVKLVSADLGEQSLNACMAFNVLAERVGLQNPAGSRLQGREFILAVREALRHHEMPQDVAAQQEVQDIRRALTQCASTMDEASAAPDTVNLFAKQTHMLANICRRQRVAIEFTCEQRNEHLVQAADLVVASTGYFGDPGRLAGGHLRLIDSKRRVDGLPPRFIAEGVSTAFTVACENDLEKNRDRLADVMDLRVTRAETACDDQASRDKLLSALRAKVDPTADKLLRMPPLKEGDTSTKVYIGDDDNPDEYVFSLRSPTVGEFRGATLRAEIAKRYVSLSELFSRGHLEATDPRLQGFVSAVWGQHVVRLADDLSDEDRRGIVDRIAAVPVGKTTLGAVLQPRLAKFLMPAQDSVAQSSASNALSPQRVSDHRATASSPSQPIALTIE